MLRRIGRFVLVMILGFITGIVFGGLLLGVIADVVLVPALPPALAVHREGVAARLGLGLELPQRTTPTPMPL